MGDSQIPRMHLCSIRATNDISSAASCSLLWQFTSVSDTDTQRDTQKIPQTTKLKPFNVKNVALLCSFKKT